MAEGKFLRFDVLAQDGNTDAHSTHPSAALKAATKLASAASRRVPAYQAVLQKAKANVDTYDALPIVTKPSYFEGVGMLERCWDGSLQHVNCHHCSSGSTGSPTIWSRTIAMELTVALVFEKVFKEAFSVDTVQTLAVIALPLGSWVGGIFTTLAIQHLKRKGLDIAVITPGNKVPDILQLTSMLAPQYKQTILIAYPPFLKGVIDAGAAQGVPWQDYNLGCILAGEVFSEEWRALVAERAGIQRPWQRIVSIYGTADAGVIAAETPFSAAARAWLAARPAAARQVFGANRLPTLCQYDPCSRLVDRHPDDGTLVVTCLSPLLLNCSNDEGPAGAAADGGPDIAEIGPPVIKYAIKDAGGLMSWDDMRAKLQKVGADLSQLEATAGSTRPAPFVWVFGRAFWCVSLYGANVYVEHIMAGVDQPEVAPFLTGKFVLSVSEDSDLNKRLHVRVEAAPGGTADDADSREQTVADVITRELKRLNSEYREYVPQERSLVKVVLHEHGDSEYFPTGVKHKYT